MISSELSDETNSKSSEHWLAANVLERLTGVAERRVSDPEEHPSDLATYAADRALAACGLPPDQIDTIIFASVSQNLWEPATLNIVAIKLGLSSTTRAFDLTNACNSFLDALDVGSALIECSRASNVLIVSGEKITPFVDPAAGDYSTFRRRLASYTLGDAGAAAITSDSGSSLATIDAPPATA